MTKVRVATVWLDGCSGCHMSFLDMDERLIELANSVEIVYGPLVDAKEFPRDVDVTLVEGAISSREDLEKIHQIRERTRILISLGDCAVTGNVPSMRNSFKISDIAERAYFELATLQPQYPDQVVPALLTWVRPVHAVVRVDIYVPGCPPPADAIFGVLCDLLAGRTPHLNDHARFGA